MLFQYRQLHLTKNSTELTTITSHLAMGSLKFLDTYRTSSMTATFYKSFATVCCALYTKVLGPNMLTNLFFSHLRSGFALWPIAHNQIRRSGAYRITKFAAIAHSAQPNLP
jgi:hypothetical protein